jgi:hypothetical protein
VNRRFALVLAASFGIALATHSAALAADAAAKKEIPAKAEPAKQPIEVINVTIHPAAVPRPALKYHLLPTFAERSPGDAMPLYAKALVVHMEAWQQVCDQTMHDKQLSSDLDNIEKWMEMPLDQLPRDRAEKLLASLGKSTRGQLDLAVRREHCNWDVPLRQGHFYEVLLPEVQQFRNLARRIALQAKLQIIDKKYGDAITSLQTGYGMARQVASQPFLVSNLVGAVVAQKMNHQLLTLCQQPDMPSLYWSIAELPSPWIDRSTAIDAEYDGLYLQWPELQAVRTARYTPDQWNLVLRKCVSELVRFEADPSKAGKSEKERLARIEKIVSKALEEASVSRAKNALLATGLSQKKLDAMPPAQIVMLSSLDTYDAIRDEVFKWWRLPYPQAIEGIMQAQREMPKAMKGEIVPLATEFLPTVGSALHAFGYTDRQFAAIRCIEALRIYAAAHNGELPATLDDIKEVPVPLNPITGKPFPYHMEGKTGVLDAVDDGLTSWSRPQYRVSVAK